MDRVTRVARYGALIDPLDWETSLLRGDEAARDLGGPAAQGHLRADGMLAEVDGTGPLRTRRVLGERDGFRARRGSIAAALDPCPQIEDLRLAALDRGPDRLGLEGSCHGRQSTAPRCSPRPAPVFEDRDPRRVPPTD